MEIGRRQGNEEARRQEGAVKAVHKCECGYLLLVLHFLFDCSLFA